MTATEPRRQARGNTTVIRAAATRIQLANRKVAKAQAGRREEWQEEGFLYFDDVGIVKQVVRFRGNQMAKLRLFAAVRPLDDPEGAPIPLSDPESGIGPDVAVRSRAEIARIKGESGGTPEILRLLDMNNEIAGEAYVIGRGPRIRTVQDPATNQDVEILIPESWDVRSILEVEVTNDGKYKVADALGGERKELDPALDTCVRIWQRHPGYAKRADCHMRGILTDLEALVLLTNEVKAESKSRQNNGILFIPNTMSVTTPAVTSPASQDADPLAIDGPPETDTEPAAVSIGEVVEEAMLDPIDDPGSPYSVLPVIVVGPADDGVKIRYIETNRKASEQLEARIVARKEAIAQGMNMPIEVAMGHANTTYANAAQIDADIWEKHLEPAAVLICDMWTIGLLQPALLDAGVSPEIADRIVVWYDATQLLDQVDPAANVAEARLAGAIGNEALRRYYGFSEDDAPTPLEMLIDAILKQRTWDPALVDAVIRMIAPELNIPDPATAGAPPPALAASLIRLRDEGPTDGARAEVLANLAELTRTVRASAPPAPKATASEKLAAVDRMLFTKSLATANAAMARALERAGNRLKAKAAPASREALRAVHPIYAAQSLFGHYGPRGLELAGLADVDLLDADAFDSTVQQFNRDARHTQEASLAIAATLAGLSAAQRRQLAARQAAHLNDASLWLRANLQDVAHERLVRPDQPEPAQGEYDPDSRVPAGLIRYAIAIAGGATALEMLGQTRDPFVALANERPPGGIGTGELIREAVTSTETVVIEGYQWDYGEAFRQHPYEPHESLDGEVAESPLDFGEDDFGPAFPGNHDGCACGPLIPVYGPLIPVYAEIPAETAGPGPVAADLFGEGA